MYGRLYAFLQRPNARLRSLIRKSFKALEPAGQPRQTSHRQQQQLAPHHRALREIEKQKQQQQQSRRGMVPAIATEAAVGTIDRRGLQHAQAAGPAAAVIPLMGGPGSAALFGINQVSQ